jgi:hypothetical protein
MSKTFTLHLSINNLASKSKHILTDVDTIYDFQREFGDVYEVLNKANLDVRQEVVDHILKMTAKSS